MPFEGGRFDAQRLLPLIHDGFGQYPGMTTIRRSEAYESPALDWMLEQVQRLREALNGGGVTDVSVQRAVCETFFFALATDLDGAEVTSRERPRRRLAFEDGEALLLPDDETFDFHDYALGVVGEAFGDA